MIGYPLAFFLFFLVLGLLAVLGSSGRVRPYDSAVFCYLALAIIQASVVGLWLRVWWELTPMGWRLRMGQVLWRSAGFGLFRFKYVMPRDEFAMTPSWNEDQSELDNLRICINLRLELKEQWIRYGVVDLALTWAEARKAAGEPKFHESQPDSAPPEVSKSESAQSEANNPPAQPEVFPTEAKTESAEAENSERDDGNYP